AAAKDAGVALDYYLHGVPVNGKTFAGFKRNRDIPYVGEFDLKQTVEDYRAVIVDGIPDPAVRQEKVFCGGHSLGGFLTGALMAWDFDGDPATTADAGYKLCHASIALDTVVTAGGQALEDNPTLSPALKSASSFAYTSVTNWVRSNLRSVDFGVIGPETMTTLEGVGLNAQIAPDADIAALMGKLPRGGASETALRLFHSRTLLDAVAPDTKLRVQHLSGEALLGAMMDDNSQPLAFIQTSFGTFDHGPVAPKQFPLSGRALMFPTDDTTPYGWANYNETLPNLLRPSGVPYSSPESEVSDVQDVARVLHEGLGFIEAYFPTRITTDVGFAQAGSRDGDLRHIRYVDAPRTLPRITIQGKEGIGVMPPQPAIGGVANEHIVLPGYNHLDLIMAAPVQRGGVPEPTAAAVARFMLEQSGRGPTPTVALRSGKASAQTVARRLRAAR
ncbi:MAG: hypothetical protein JHC95_23590, partial [Solirubrobacteraceae bacterium]|nr:hypothetical protein [Solirubrobacteraceae bacterium]